MIFNVNKYLSCFGLCLQTAKSSLVSVHSTVEKATRVLDRGQLMIFWMTARNSDLTFELIIMLVSFSLDTIVWVTRVLSR